MTFVLKFHFIQNESLCVCSLSINSCKDAIHPIVIFLSLSHFIWFWNSPFTPLEGSGNTPSQVGVCSALQDHLVFAKLKQSIVFSDELKRGFAGAYKQRKIRCWGLVIGPKWNKDAKTCISRTAELIQLQLLHRQSHFDPAQPVRVPEFPG